MLKVMLRKKGTENVVDREFLDMIETVYDTDDNNDIEYYDGIFEEAENNTKETACIGSFLGMPILSNTDNNLEAGVICNSEFMDKVLKEFNSEFIYILPSSIHEVIVVPPNDKFTEEGLVQTVRDVNTMLEPHEVLSDSAYKYFGKGKWVVIS